MIGQQLLQRPGKLTPACGLPDVDSRADGLAVTGHPPTQFSFLQQLLQPRACCRENAFLMADRERKGRGTVTGVRLGPGVL